MSSHDGSLDLRPLVNRSTKHTLQEGRELRILIRLLEIRRHPAGGLVVGRVDRYGSLTELVFKRSSCDFFASDLSMMRRFRIRCI